MMMKNNKKRLISWIARELKMFPEELETSEEWPEAAKRLWLDLAQNDTTQIEQGDEMMLSIVVNDAIDGVDITERYPEFYQRMLQNPELFRAFLDAVEVMETDRVRLLESVPEIKADLPVWRPLDSDPFVVRFGPGAWKARWRQSVEELTAVFRNLSPFPQPGYRSGWGLLEESSAPLIRSEVMVEDTTLGVLLTTAWADDADMMNLQLTVTLMDDEMGRDSAELNLSSLTADIQWGDYQEVSAINEYGQAVFPPLPIDAITDETGQSIKGDLQLMLHPAD
jgi:hypothetical protein